MDKSHRKNKKKPLSRKDWLIILLHFASFVAKCLTFQNRLPVATEYETLHMLQISVIVAPLPLNEQNTPSPIKTYSQVRFILSSGSKAR